MNVVQFLEAVKRDEELLAQGKVPFGMDGCDECGKPLQTSITGRHRLGDNTQICANCYDDLMSAHLEQHPIRALRLMSRGSKDGAHDAANDTGTPVTA